MDQSWVPDPACDTRSLASGSKTSLSLVTGDHSANPVPPLRTVHLNSRSVVGAEALGRLHLTKLPLLWC
eukprot:8453968-Pyramimonas_sp.AAC.1